MAPFIGAVGQNHLIAAINRLHRLADDLTRIAGDDMPTRDELEEAPLIDGYAVSEMTLRCLVGQQSGHPEVSGKFIQTSELWCMAPELGWARTMTRFYRLGRPLHALQHS